MAVFFLDAYGVVGKVRHKCEACSPGFGPQFGSGVDPYGETCFRCAGYGWVCYEGEVTAEEKDEFDDRTFD